MTIYVVSRPFWSFGQLMQVGTILESLDQVRTGRLKIGEGKLWKIDTENEKELASKIAGLEARGVKNMKEKILAFIAPPITPSDEIEEVSGTTVEKTSTSDPEQSQIKIEEIPVSNPDIPPVSVASPKITVSKNTVTVKPLTKTTSNK